MNEATKKPAHLAGFVCAGLAAGFGFTFGMGGADHTRFNASLNGINGVSPSLAGSCFFRGSVMVDEFCASLGRFVMEFARAEQMAKDLLVDYAELSAPAGRAVLDGLRLKPVISKIRRLHEAKGKPIHPRLEEAFAQLMTILSMRDKILHQGFEFADDKVTTTNWSTAHLDKNIRVENLTLEMIEAMTADLRRAQLYMIYWGPGEITPEWDLAMQNLAQEPQPPWLYKPPQPQHANPKS